jgi:hypothetical protein
MLTVDRRVQSVELTDDTLVVSLRDGRVIRAPLRWFPRLENASPKQRGAWRPSAAGHGIHWPEIDEDLSIKGLLRGRPAPR